MGSFLTILTTFKSVASAIKLVIDAFNKFADAKIDKKAQEVKDHNNTIIRQIEHETKKDNPSDETLRNLHRKLNNIKLK